MTFILTATAVLILIGFVLAWVVQGGLSKKRRRAPGFWKRLLMRQLFLLPVHVFVLLPGLLGFAGSQLVRTRADEVRYAGPAFDAKGMWIIQDRATLKAGPPDTPEDEAARAKREVRFASSDGRECHGYLVKCRDGKPKVVAILVHGLFRNAMEVEPVANMLWEMGADVLLVEMSNHGASSKHKFTFGWRENRDVLGAVEYLRSRPGGISAPLVLYGVSMGGVAVALAAPEVPELRGLVVDAPMPNLVDTAHRQLERFLKFPSFYTSLILWHLELWSGFDMADVRPIDAFAALPKNLPSLMIGAGQDYRVPPAVVQECFAALRAEPPVKDLLIEPGAKHGRVWEKAPGEYRKRLAALLARVARSR